MTFACIMWPVEWHHYNQSLSKTEKVVKVHCKSGDVSDKWKAATLLLVQTTNRSDIWPV